jgi:hypothetical protein
MNTKLYFTEAMVAEIQASDKTPMQLAEIYGLPAPKMAKLKEGKLPICREQGSKLTVIFVEPDFPRIRSKENLRIEDAREKMRKDLAKGKNVNFYKE